MNINENLIWLILICFGKITKCDLNPQDITYNHDPENNLKSTYTVLSESISKVVKNQNAPETCSTDDFSCFAMGSQDRLGLEAIKALHDQLDDDRNGNVDLTETDDFLREELKYDSGYEKRQKAFHKNDDTHVSVKELWEAWLKSEVHNWTTQQTSEWLAVSVELPQYINNFLRHKVTGATLPRLAVNNTQLLNTLGIKDPIHRQKIALKAMDVVLFGPPKDHHPYWKDLTLIVLIVGGGIGLYYAVQQNKKFRAHLNRMYKDMEGLQRAETALEDLQKELEQAVQAKEDIVSEKQTLEKKLQEAATESTTMHNSYSDLEVSQLKAEIEMLRRELHIAEGELKDRCWSPPLGLQQWLQLTHEIENKAYIKKRLLAEKQLHQAREACEKLRKKRSSLVGAFVSTHGKSIDDVDRSIVEARTSLNEVTQALQERVYRWKQIESLCGFNIISNGGLQQLENILYRNSNMNGRTPLSMRGRMSSQDDLDDDTSSIYTTGYIDTVGGSVHSWKEADSSGSETSKHDDEIGFHSRSGVQFLVGGEISVEEPMLSITKNNRFSHPPQGRSITNNIITKNMVRSYSQDVNIMAASDNISPSPKPACSEPSLDFQVKPKPIRQKTIQEQPSGSVEDEIYSTDSSLAEDEVKKRKRKLFGFSKKNKMKGE